MQRSNAGVEARTPQRGVRSTRPIAVRTVAAAIASVTAAGVLSGCEPSDVTPPADGWSYDLGAARKLRLLYAGVPDEPRGERFLAFLRANFDDVEAIELDDLDADRAAERDVVVSDWRVRWSDGQLAKVGWEWPEVRLGPDFTKPLVLMSNAPLSVQQQGSKLTSW